jgi:hypothetical protein
MSQYDILEIIGWVVYGICSFQLHSRYASEQKLKKEREK